MLRVCAFLAALTSCASATHAADLSGEFGGVSDYRYRGLTLSDGRPALQGTLTLEHKSGVYGSLWASSISSPGNGLGAEFAVTAGYAADLVDGFALDVSGSYFLYPGDSASNYVEVTALASLTRGDASAGLGISLVPEQAGTRDELGGHRNSYVFGEAEVAVPRTSATVKLSAGYENGYFDEADRGGKLDWSAGVVLDADPAKVGLAYAGYRTRDRSGGGLIASLSIGL